MKLFLFRALLLLLFIPAVTYAQPTDIRHADGSPLESLYCRYDENIQIEGVPAGGTFSGCGVFQQGGNWYFNPVVAAGGASGGAFCSLMYTTGTGSITRNIQIYNEIVVYVIDDAIVCGDSFYLYGDMGPVGPYTWHWTGPGIIIDSLLKGTYAILPPGSRGTYVFYTKNTYNGCEASDSVVIETRERLDFRFTAGDTIYHTSGLPVLLETRANRGYSIVSWEPAALFPDQTALQQSVAVDTPVRITATAVSEDSCTDITRIQVLVLPAGVSQGIAHEQIQLYPNPAVNEMHIRSSQPIIVYIRDVTGKEVLHHRMQAAGEVINIRSLLPGMYLVYLSDRQGNLLPPQRLVKMAE